jgi:DNA-binding NarL/FixJ family response regulator
MKRKPDVSAGAAKLGFDGGALIVEVTLRIPVKITYKKDLLDLREHPWGKDFTNRQEEICQALVDGLRNKEIAQKLNITERTVKFHVSAVLVKMNCEGRAEVINKLWKHVQTVQGVRKTAGEETALREEETK